MGPCKRYLRVRPMQPRPPLPGPLAARSNHRRGLVMAETSVKPAVRLTTICPQFVVPDVEDNFGFRLCFSMDFQNPSGLPRSSWQVISSPGASSFLLADGTVRPLCKDFRKETLIRTWSRTLGACNKTLLRSA